MSTPDHQTVIIGAGFSGIGVAIGLDRAGLGDYVILEEGDGVGGTWHWNTYPGVGVDIPSFSYQFSFETSADWSRVYAPGNELKSYAEHCVDTYHLRSRIRLNTKVSGLVFDDTDHLWHIRTTDGTELTARFVVGATGTLTQPKPPEIAGFADYAGTVMHTARWDHSQDLRGKRVAIIGTGASAVQVIPTIAPEVEHLTVFQRTPIRCLPKLDAPLPKFLRALLRRVPAARWPARWLSQAFVELNFPLSAHYYGKVPLAKYAEKMGLRHLRQVKDPKVREKLTPRYGLGCKRPSFSNKYLKAFNRDDVHLETTPIETFTKAGIRTTDGTEHAVDAVILATGFKVYESGNMPPFPITGTGGVDLDQWWDTNRYQAYEGVSVPGFPNLFTVMGPYGFNGASYFHLIETQTRHIIRCLTRAQQDRATRIEVTPEANERYFAEMLARRGDQVFFRPSCANANSYYFDKHGDVPLRPSTSVEATWRSGHFDLDDYRFTVGRR
ncbi:NAD(P)/FAD-dependent oxidoreductase [Pseudonocardiaceae bacterium YIM PH 21723]|nr:NAD(P)/FAD-dependent oxidoreductase [Pseudonocardiaceae bacterium YIM PH 21723]